MTVATNPGGLCLTSALDCARSSSIDSALETFPELKPHRLLLSNIVENMLCIDELEQSLQRKIQELDVLSDELKAKVA